MIHGSRRIYPCKEHEEVSVPIHELIVDGRLQIYPEIAAKGYFDISYQRGQLIMRTRGWVGLIPISDNVAIHVSSRVPISNLLYMVWRAKSSPKRIEGFLRTYGIDTAEVFSGEELYAGAFLSTLREITRTGPIKRYMTHESDSRKRGRLNINKTLKRFHSKGCRHRHVFEVTDYSVDNMENRIIKSTAQRLYRYFQRDPKGDNKEIALESSRLLQLLTTVEESSICPKTIVRGTAVLARALPRHNQYYEPALWLAYLIASKGGVVLETFGRAKFETLVINVAEVFETYIRQLCLEASSTVFGGARVVDGNKHPVSLFSASKHKTKPDIYFTRDSKVLGVADVKYKPKLKANDRYELLAFCNALDVTRALFICPHLPGQRLVERLGQTKSKIEVSVARMELGSSDMPLAELDLQRSIANLLMLTT